MRIGFDARSLLEAQPSGVSVYTEEILKALLRCTANKGYILCIYSSGRQVSTSRIQELMHGYTHVEWRHVAQSNKWLRLFGQPVDVVLKGIDVLFMPNWNSVRLSAHVPLVLTVHDLAYTLFPQALSLKRRLWHWWVQPERLMRRAKQRIAVSHVTAQALQPLSSVVIHSATPQRVTAEPIDVPKRYVYMAATLEPRKNLIAAIQAMQQLWQQGSDLELVISGPTGWKRSHLEHYLQHPKVHYLGYLTPGEKWHVLQHATVLLYPSLYEGFGFPPLEAFSVGVPVVASVHGASPEVCGDAALYVNPYSVSDIANAIEAITTEPLHAQYVAKGKTQLLGFNWQYTGEHTLRVIEEALY